RAPKKGITPTAIIVRLVENFDADCGPRARLPSCFDLECHAPWETQVMASPFPGMDPYLEDEKHWPVFQHHLVGCLYQAILPGLVDGYRARVGQRQDTTEQALFTSIIRDSHEEEMIEIRQRSDGRLITLVEVVSPANKTTPEGRKAYLTKREESRAVR